MEQPPAQLVQHLGKFDIFSGLSTDELRKIIRICHNATFNANDQVCKAGEDGRELFILMRGHLIVVSPKGEPLGSITSGECVGEMEVFSGEPRVANVVASSESGGVVIHKDDIERLMTRNPPLYNKLLRNAFRILCRRLSRTNELVETHHLHEAPETAAGTRV